MLTEINVAGIAGVGGHDDHPHPAHPYDGIFSIEEELIEKLLWPLTQWPKEYRESGISRADKVYSKLFAIMSTIKYVVRDHTIGWKYHSHSILINTSNVGVLTETNNYPRNYIRTGSHKHGYLTLILKCFH